MVTSCRALRARGAVGVLDGDVSCKRAPEWGNRCELPARAPCVACGP